MTIIFNRSTWNELFGQARSQNLNLRGVEISLLPDRYGLSQQQAYISLIGRSYHLIMCKEEHLEPDNLRAYNVLVFVFGEI
jgi:hypothetical protein